MHVRGGRVAEGPEDKGWVEGDCVTGYRGGLGDGARERRAVTRHSRTGAGRRCGLHEGTKRAPVGSTRVPNEQQ